MSATLLDPAALAAAPAAAPTLPPAARARRVGHAVSGLAVAFLAFDTWMKFAAPPVALAGTAELGWQPHHMGALGVLSLACLALYLVPRTAVLGAVLWTGYLGGAVAAHLRLDHPLLSHTLFPVYVAALLWGGLYLRDARVRALVGPAR
jgi:hypothetical protein